MTQKRARQLLFCCGLLLFLFAFGVIQYFLWSDLFIAEFDADNAETVMWAEASLMSHALLSKEYVYGHLLPVGGNLLLLPFVRYFGTSMLAMRLGMCCFSCIFCVLLVSLFRRLDFSYGESFLSAGILLLLTTGQEGLRDIFWAHCVYYNMSILFMMGMFNGIAAWYRNPRRDIRSLVPLLIAVFLGSINGYGVLAYTALPFFLALLTLLLMDGYKDRKKTILCIGALTGVMLLGLLLYRFLTADLLLMDYTDAHLVIQSAENWLKNFLKFPSAWVGLFTALPEQSVPFFSPVGIKMALRILTALSSIILILPALSNCGKTKPRLAALFTLYHGFAFCLILFLYIFGNISEHAHRLYPIFFNTLVLDAIVLRDMLRRTEGKAPYLMKVIGVGLSLCWSCTALLSGVSVLRQPIDLDFLHGADTIYTRLTELGISKGYTTFYWSGNNVTVLSDGAIQSREIAIREGDFAYPYYQHNRRWYEQNTDSGPVFLVCKEAEYYDNPWLEEEALNIIRASDYSDYEDTWRGFFILVYDRDIVAESLARQAQNSVSQ